LPPMTQIAPNAPMTSSAKVTSIYKWNMSNLCKSGNRARGGNEPSEFVALMA
jgi:hypothetical protein